MNLPRNQVTEADDRCRAMPDGHCLADANGWRVSTQNVEAVLQQGCNSYAYVPQFIPSDESGVIPRDSGSPDC